MSYSRSPTQGDALSDILEQEQLAIWSRTGLSEQQRYETWSQRKAQLVARILDTRSTPRAVHKEPGTPAPPQAHGTAQRGLANGTRGAPKMNRQASAPLVAVPMARTNTNKSSHLSSISPSPSNRLDINTAAKRTHQQSDTGYSASYTYGTAWQPNNPALQQRQDDIVFNPHEYIERHSSDHSASTVKRPRVHGLSPNSFNSYQAGVSPSTSVSHSLLSPTPLTFSSSGEAMSRQSSETSTSAVDALNMMRIDSSMSACSEHFPFPLDIESRSCDSFLSIPATEHASNSFRIPFSHDFDAMSFKTPEVPGDLQDLLFHDAVTTMTSMGQDMALNPNSSAPDQHSTDMVRSTSNESSTSASSAENKACERLQKQIRNAQRQTILSKTLPTAGPTSTPLGKKDSKSRPIRPQEPGSQRKELIPKQQPYIRPQHPKLYCTRCTDYPDGFRGEHELRRHHDRRHAQKRKVWICVDPHTESDAALRPTRPLEICKQCKQRKPYNVYYNAAAHLRRAHFHPRRRGRKPKGEKPEKRAGKAGGDDPPINWLKEAGYLVEIEVGADDAATAEGVPMEDEDEDDDDFEGGPGEAELELQPDAFPPLMGEGEFLPHTFAAAEQYMGYMTPGLEGAGMQWATPPPPMMAQAPMMAEHMMSVPPMMISPLDDYGRYCSPSGFGFMGDTMFAH